LIPLLKLTITRDSISLPDLVACNVPTEGGSRFTIADDGLGFPSFPYRYNWAPDSDYQDGKELLGAVRDQGTLPAVLHATGTDIADLLDARLELEEAVAQVTYTVAISLHGSDLGPWDAFPIAPSWGDSIDFGLAAQAQTRVALQFLVNP